MSRGLGSALRLLRSSSSIPEPSRIHAGWGRPVARCCSRPPRFDRVPLLAKGLLMRFRIRAVALPSLALGLLVSVGCGQPSNEEELKGSSVAVPHKEGTPDFKSYGE